QLENFYIHGCKSPGSYIKIPANIISSGTFDICNSDGSLMAFICSALPYHIWECLTDDLVSCFDGENIL
ncbi:hypothetical protein DFJ58DRAFT_631278, partial [Suillus subalutaceus]|uniref:uncharacterized protein n=1 Tax=Suillus subalutaceus TaxID=48586 RepID=UPI001B87C8ED